MECILCRLTSARFTMPVALAVMIGKSPLCEKSHIGGVICF
jgi:hypothetical protein